MIDSAAPVMLHPTTGIANLPPKRIALAWNGGRECANALRSSLSFTQGVEQIDVISIGDSGEDAAAISVYLERHGYEVNVHVIDSSGSNCGEALLQTAKSLDVQCLLMGAYGHSRLRELVLGGTTEYVIENAEIPVILHH